MIGIFNNNKSNNNNNYVDCVDCHRMVVGIGFFS